MSANLAGDGYTAGTVLNVTLVVKNSTGGVIATSDSTSVAVTNDGSIPAATRIELTTFATCILPDGDYTTHIVVAQAPTDICGEAWSDTDFNLTRTVKSFTINR